MSLKKKKIITNLATILLICILVLMQDYCFATNADSIGTAEVQAATDNIKRVIVSIAMPLRWCVNFCQCCNYCIKNDN